MRLEKSEDLDNVYKLFGICAHYCSNIEYGVAFLLYPVKWKNHSIHLESKKQKMHKKLHDFKEWNSALKEFDVALDKVDPDIDKLYTMTLGNLIKQIKDNYSLLEEQEKYLGEIVEKRNYVIHKMWGVYGRRLKNPSVIKEMLKELQDCEVYFRLASDWLWKQARILNGIPEEMQ